MEARLFISPKCFTCRWVEPLLRLWFSRRGVRLSIYKLQGDHAYQVNGDDVIAVDTAVINATPALQVGRIIVIGSGIVSWLREASRR